MLNQMTAAQRIGLDRRFAYTAAGERILEWDQNASKYTLSLRRLGNEALREVSYSYSASTGSWQVFWEKDTIWAGSRLLASVSRTEGIQHYHVDHLGSPRIVTNRCGQRVKLFDHNPWGLDRFATTQDSERHRFTAHQRDVGDPTRSWDDLDYMHARYSTGYLGRFLSVDPGRDWDVSHPQSFNFFGYVHGNPVVRWDPNGMQSGSNEEKRPDCGYPERDLVCGGRAREVRAPAAVAPNLGSDKFSCEWLAAAMRGRGQRSIGVRPSASDDPLLQMLATIGNTLTPREKMLVGEFDKVYDLWFASPQLGLNQQDGARYWGPVGNMLYLWGILTGQNCGSSCTAWAVGLYRALEPLNSPSARALITQRWFPLPHTAVTVQVRRGENYWVSVRRYDPFWRIK